MPQIVPVVGLIAFAVVVAAALLTIDSLLGPRRPNPTKLSPYECGMPPVGSARERVHAKFFLVALLFILFDVEAIFFFLWGAVLKPLGVFGLIEVLVFLGFLTFGLIYAWGKGALEWD
jgi:NADH-quinone oxidoreductase subunit A